MKKTLLPLIVAVLSVFVMLNSCKKTDAPAIPGIPDSNNSDLITKITTSVSGFVADESNMPVASASVVAGTKTTTTDAKGYFEINDASLVANAAVVTISKSGYFNGVKTWIAANGKAGFFRIKLLAKASAGTVSGTTGGSVTLSNGLKIAFPAAAFVNASTNAAYTGTVTVNAKWIDPSSAELINIMPGDLRGKNASGTLKALTTYGMSATELIGGGGELLQIATGKKATITFPIPASILSTAPATIPLWSFDETTGLWKEESSATRTGSTYVGDVSHFSFWNCDVPANYVYVDVTINDATGNSVANAVVKITNLSNGQYAYGYTNTDGYVAGAVAANTQFLLQVVTSASCPFILHAQNFSTAASNISLGSINMISNRTAAVSGNLTTCTNAQVHNGVVVFYHDNIYNVVHTDTAGHYRISLPVCSGTTVTTTISAADPATGNSSSVITQVLQAGSTNPVNIQTCTSVNTNEFLNYTMDGISHSYIMPPDTLRPNLTAGPTNYLFYAYKQIGSANPYPTTLEFPATGIAVGSSVQVIFMLTHEYDYFAPGTGSFNVNITEFGPPGTGYIAGTLSGTAATVPTNVPHQLNGSFKVRRPF